MISVATSIIYTMDMLGFLVTIYLIFIKPLQQKNSQNKKLPYDGVYMEIVFKDMGIQTGSVPPINISEAWSSAGGYIEGFMRQFFHK